MRREIFTQTVLQKKGATKWYVTITQAAIVASADVFYQKKKNGIYSMSLNPAILTLSNNRGVVIIILFIYTRVMRCVFAYAYTHPYKIYIQSSIHVPI